MKKALLIFICLFICWAVLNPVYSEDMEQVVNSINSFAFDLYGELTKEEGNIFFSPYSISSALAMTYAGARGNTEKQMQEALYFDLGQDIHPYFSELQSSLDTSEEDKGYELYIANALWGQKDYPFLDEFIDLNEMIYGAGLNLVDFRDEEAREEARLAINNWTEEKTNQKIQELIKEGVLDDLTRLVLTNAIYFKGNWASQFEVENTTDKPFYVSSDVTKDVPTMYQKSIFKYTEDSDAQLIDLPYVEEDLSMLIILPKERFGLKDIEDKITVENVNNWLLTTYEQEVEVYLPKFKVEASFKLNENLQSLGMVDAFDMSADFSGIDGGKSLYISDVIHKAFIDVNEEGTEAAAATAVIIGLESIMEIPIFQADHPFIYLIRDNNSGSILFMGRLVDPTA